MDMTGERRIPAPRETVWNALNDPIVLKQSIPGCESLEKVSDTAFKAVASVKIGPISARFTGRVELTEIDPPNGYRIGGEGQGGVAGFAKGGATVALTDEGTDTLLRYDVKAQVGGKIAQLGARLIDASAKSMADQFFNRFVAQVAAPGASGEVLPIASTTDAAIPTTPAGMPAPATAGNPVPEPATQMPGGLLMQAAATPVGPTSAAPAPAASTSTAPAPDAWSAAPIRPFPVAEPARISLLSLVPTEIAGYPLVAWIGAVLFFVVFVMIFSAYL